MNDTKSVRYGFLFAVLAFEYIVGVATLLTNAQQLFGLKRNVLAPIGFLVLFAIVFFFSLFGARHSVA